MEKMYNGRSVGMEAGRSAKPSTGMSAVGRHDPPPNFTAAYGEIKREKHSQDSYSFVSRNRGSDYRSQAMEQFFRPSSSGGSTTGSYISTSSTTGTSENPPQQRTKRWLASLYKNIARKDPDAKVMDDINTATQLPQERKNIGNEIRCIEKLKLHLIKQNRDKDARRLIELYQKLKGMSVPQNREAVILLLYELFDKETTRAIMEARAAQTLTDGLKHDGKQKLGNQINTTQASAPVGQQLEKRVPENFRMEDFDSTPIPRLNLQSDKMAQELLDKPRIPSLSKPCRIYGETTSHWDSLNRMDNTQFGDPFPLITLSNISKHSGDFHHLTNSSAVHGSAPNIFTSTPRDVPNPCGKQKQFNFRHHETPSGNNNVTLRANMENVNSMKFIVNFGHLRSVERILVQDVTFILQGIDGAYIKFNSKGSFDIRIKERVHTSLRKETLKLCELGYFYRHGKMFTERPIPGSMSRGFRQAVEEELAAFYRMLAVIHSRVQQTIVDTPMSEDLPESKDENITMHTLGIWLFDSRPRLRLLHTLIKRCKSKRGGEICSEVHEFANNGDPAVHDLSVSLLSNITRPLYVMLSQWILYGELDDADSEFFIAGDSFCKREHLWHQKYKIRAEMLPSFIPIKQAEKILAIGKNINFLKEICNNQDGFEGRKEIKTLLESGRVDSVFLEESGSIHYAIGMAYKSTSEKVLKVLIEDTHLLDHLKAIKKYLLLGQGDFVQYFLELIQEELNKPASKLFNHNAYAILEAAVRSTNAQFEREDILSRLDIRILPSSDKDIGWDVFCLDYKTSGPIGTVLTEEVMNAYNKLFNSLWRTKRIEYILSSLWKNQAALFKDLRLIPEMAPVLHRSQLLISEMIHFVHQTQYYIMFEATECAWDKLMDDVNKSSDLDEVIVAHKKFLDTIFGRSLLDAQNRGLLNQLRGIFDSVHELKLFLEDFHRQVEVEVNLRKNLAPNSKEAKDAQRKFFSSYIHSARGKIDTLYTTTQDLVRMFLLVLNREQDLTLQCLSFRLDFNEYYHMNDSRLTEPLTFQHRRLSSNSYSFANACDSISGIVGGPSRPLATSTSILESTED